MSNSREIEDYAVKMEDDKSTPSREELVDGWFLTHIISASGKMAEMGDWGDLCAQQSKLGAWCVGGIILGKEHNF